MSDPNLDTSIIAIDPKASSLFDDGDVAYDSAETIYVMRVFDPLGAYDAGGTCTVWIDLGSFTILAYGLSDTLQAVTKANLNIIP